MKTMTGCFMAQMLFSKARETLRRDLRSLVYSHDRLVHVRPTRQSPTDLHPNPERNTPMQVQPYLNHNGR